MSSNVESDARRHDIVKVRRDILAACMTCPLCKQILQDATTICECLHTFCRKCILEKLSDEELECCPMCDIYLGCDPVEKLRPDHNLEDLRTKMFPLKSKKVNAPEVAPTPTLPVRRKERSLSSLVVNTPRVSSNLTGRRTKVINRKASRPCPMISENVIKEDMVRVENSNSIQTPSKSTQNKRQKFSNTELANHTPNKELENGKVCSTDKSEIWKPLNCLVEAANRTRGPKPGPYSPSIKPDQSNIDHSDNNDNMNNLNIIVQDDNNNNNMVNNGSISMAPTKRRRRRRRDIGTSTTQAIIDFTRSTATHERRATPIWISIVPSLDQQQDATLLEHPACYLRLKDGNLPVSFIQKYLVTKLNISSEAEVEIECRGQPVNPIQPICSLADVWQQDRLTQRAHASIGASAKDFVLVLNYKSKPQAP